VNKFNIIGNELNDAVDLDHPIIVQFKKSCQARLDSNKTIACQILPIRKFLYFVKNQPTSSTEKSEIQYFNHSLSL